MKSSQTTCTCRRISPIQTLALASFPGLPRFRFLIACSIQKLSQFLHIASDQKPVFAYRKRSKASFCIPQAIKNRSPGRPGNEATLALSLQHACSNRQPGLCCIMHSAWEGVSYKLTPMILTRRICSLISYMFSILPPSSIKTYSATHNYQLVQTYFVC